MIIVPPSLSPQPGGSFRRVTTTFACAIAALVALVTAAAAAAPAIRPGDRIAIMRDGRFVQVGTPAEVVMQPADDYVANFVRDVPRSHVVPVDAVMGPAGNGPFAGEVESGSKIREAVGLVAHSDLPVRVVRGGKRGVIPQRLAPILERLHLDLSAWMELMHHAGAFHGSAFGNVAARAREAVRRGARWIVDVTCGLYGTTHPAT